MSTRYFLSAVPDGIKTQKVSFKSLSAKVVVIDPKEVDESDADILGRLDKDQKKFNAITSGKPVPRIVSPYDVPSIYDVVFGTTKTS